MHFIAAAVPADDQGKRGQEEWRMDDNLRNWNPDEQELEAIMAELRPIIMEFAGRDRLAQEEATGAREG